MTEERGGLEKHEIKQVVGRNTDGRLDLGDQSGDLVRLEYLFSYSFVFCYHRYYVYWIDIWTNKAVN